MTGLLEDKVALVTGASSGIGSAAVLLMAAEGARVLAADIDGERGEAVAEQARALGADAEFMRTDVSREADVAALVARATERFGRLDCALNNAGISGPAGPLHTIDYEAWKHTLGVNLDGVFLCMKYEIPVMQAQGGGAIVNTSSGAGMIATPAMAPYCASKHAILGITRTAAVENAQTGVRINAICPGVTDTPMLRATMEIDPSVEKMILASAPSGRLGEAKEIAEAAIWLCSDRASYVSGHSMLVDGGAVAR
jgi:NAD(P)-dependent dehydrogenase (short-subunit alcohol dehydrogenase family)